MCKKSKKGNRSLNTKSRVVKVKDIYEQNTRGISSSSVFILCNTIKSLLLFMASLFIGFLVEKYVACQSRISDFGWHSFSFLPRLMRKSVEKPEAILALLDDSFQCTSNGKPEQLFYLIFVFYI